MQNANVTRADVSEQDIFMFNKKKQNLSNSLVKVSSGIALHPPSFEVEGKRLEFKQM